MQIDNIRLITQYHRQKIVGTSCTYLHVPILGCSGDQSPDLRFAQSPDRFVGFRSIRQKHHNCEAQLEKMAPCKFSNLRTIYDKISKLNEIMALKGTVIEAFFDILPVTYVV